MDQEKLHFYLRKLHSLTGFLPIGVFLLEHFFTNAFVLNGAQAWNEAAETIASLPGLPFIEIGMLVLPIGFHSIYGVMISGQSRPNLAYYPYSRNLMYFLQRITGVILLLFIAYHVWNTRMQNLMHGTIIDYQFMAEYFAPVAIKVVYILGVLSAVFHFANGLWNMSVSWGLATTRTGQRNVAVVCALLFVAMAVVGVATVFGFKA